MLKKKEDKSVDISVYKVGTFYGTVSIKDFQLY